MQHWPHRNLEGAAVPVLSMAEVHIKLPENRTLRMATPPVQSQMLGRRGSVLYNSALSTCTSGGLALPWGTPITSHTAHDCDFGTVLLGDKVYNVSTATATAAAHGSCLEYRSHLTKLRQLILPCLLNECRQSVSLQSLYTQYLMRGICKWAAGVVHCPAWFCNSPYFGF